MPGVPPKKATSFIFYTALVDTANQPDFKASPTIASGDFKLSIDATSGVSLAANPAAVTGATTIVRFTVSGAEMDGDVINIMCVDAAGAEWDDQLITIHTETNQIDDLATIISANLAAINSNATALGIVKSDTVVIRSDTLAIRSDAATIITDTGTTVPGLISANLTAINSNGTALGIVKSDTVFIRSDTIAIRAGTTTLISDVLTAVSDNLTAINSNATALGILKSDTVVIRSDTLFTRSEAVSILADTGTTVPGLISDNLAAINSNATALGILKSDAVVIRSDTLATRSDAVAILADTGTTVPGLISANLAAINSNATGISANATSIATVAQLIVASGTVETSGSNSSTQVQTNLAEATNDHYDVMTILFTSGDEAGQSRLITSYTGATGVVGWNAALTGTPADDVTFIILSAGTTADAVWDEILTGASHNIATSAGRRLRQIEQAFVHANGTIAGVTSANIYTLDAGAVAEGNYYHGDRLQISEGTGAGQSRIILTYTSGRVATLDSDFTTNPDTNSLYEIDAADAHVPALEALPEQISDNLAAINSNATGISANLTAIDSNALGISANATLVAANLTAINSNALGISANATLVAANLTAINSNALGISANATLIATVSSLLDDARAEPGQGAPPVNPDAMTKIDYLYKNWRNRKTQTSDTLSIFADDATTVDQKSTISDDGTTGERGEVGTGA